VHGDVVNDEDVISAVPIAVVRGEGEVGATAVPMLHLRWGSLYVIYCLQSHTNHTCSNM